MGIDNPVHIIFLAAVALIVLGPRRLPEVARALGKGMREFREAMQDASEGVLHSDSHDPHVSPAAAADRAVYAEGAVSGDHPAPGALVQPGVPAESARQVAQVEVAEEQ